MHLALNCPFSEFWGLSNAFKFQTFKLATLAVCVNYHTQIFLSKKNNSKIFSKVNCRVLGLPVYEPRALICTCL